MIWKSPISSQVRNCWRLMIRTVVVRITSPSGSVLAHISLIGRHRDRGTWLPRPIKIPSESDATGCWKKDGGQRITDTVFRNCDQLLHCTVLFQTSDDSTVSLDVTRDFVLHIRTFL